VNEHAGGSVAARKASYLGRQVPPSMNPSW